MVQWLIVSVILAVCAGFAVRAIIRSVRKGFGLSLDEFNSRSACGGCSGCKSSPTGQLVQIATLESRTPKAAIISNEESQPMSGQYQ